MTEVLIRYYDVIKRTSGAIYQMFDGEKLTHSELMEEADRILPKTLRNPEARSMPEYTAILQCVVDLYEAEVGIQTYAPTTLAKDKASKYWLYKTKPTIPHPFFERYKLYLSKDGFAQKSIENIEATCEEILAHCANPRTPSAVDKKRGLVVGDVQSGKTANYLGLVNMAYDYGYRIVILLAGTTNSLRTQTQKRTDKGVIGAKSDSIGNSVEHIGVGFSTHEHYVVPFTNQTNDFARFIQKNLNTAIGDLNKPVVLVVKKVKSILESVSERLQSELSEKGLDSKSILIIDDEADNASVNTAKPGNDPTTINRAIRAIFNKFPIASYVGYTATPFANVFIDPSDEDPENLDLFPSDFITQLHAPDNYFGGRKVFPKDSDSLPRCLRLISEEEPFFLPVIHDKYTQYFGLSESLKEAIHSFLINNVVRTLRNQPTKHRSMMINITRFNDVQTEIWYRVQEYIKTLTDAIEELSNKSVDAFIADKNMCKIYELFTESDFYQIVRDGSEEYNTAPISWSEIQAGLYDEIKNFNTVVINSRNGKMTQIDPDGKNKRFDYEDYEDDGARVIAIGGMVLSRGLTLEGLMTSYYSRNAGTYDTLLQMCRWFGYRPKYEDLCRVYLTQENIDRFDAVLDAVEDLKTQLSEMERQGKSPKDFGLMIKESPDTLETTMLITARNKLRGTDIIECRLNYGGVYADTSKLVREAVVNNHNTKAVNYFISKIEEQFSWQNGRYFMAQQIKKFDIAELIRKLKIPYVNKKFDTEGLSEYVENSEIFPYWDVVIATGDRYRDDPMTITVNGEELPCVQRRFHVNGEHDSYIRIGGTNNRVMDPSIFDAGLWISKAKREAILEEKRNKDTKGRDFTELSVNDYLERRSCPILIIYPIDLKTEIYAAERTAWGVRVDELEKLKIDIKSNIGEDTPLMAFAVGFPKKESGVTVTYRANKIKLDQLNANLEVDDDEEGVEDDDD